MNIPSKIFKTLSKIYPSKFSLNRGIYMIVDEGRADREVGTSAQLFNRLHDEIKSEKENAHCYRIDKKTHAMPPQESMSPRVAHENIKHDLKQMLLLTKSNHTDLYVRTIDNSDIDKLTMSDIFLIAMNNIFC